MTEAFIRKHSVSSDVEELNARFRRPLLRFFTRRVGCPAEAEDLTQEVFFRLLRRSSPAVIENKDGFIFTTATNLLRDRARSRRDRPQQAEVREESVDASLIEVCTPDRVILGRERLLEVLECLYELEPRTRDAFLMFRVDRMRQRDIAKALGVSVSAVEKYVARAAAHLVTRLQLLGQEGSADGL